MTTITPLQAIERLIDEGHDAYESMVALAHSVEVDTMAHRFLLGDLALLVRKSYGRNRMATFATAANIARSTMAQYKSVSQFYPEDVRSTFENLAYSQFRDAMRLKENALDFLDEVSANQWTIEQTKIEVKKRVGIPTPPLKLLDAEGCIESIDYTTGKLVFMVAPGADLALLEQWLQRDVRVKVYELSE